MNHKISHYTTNWRPFTWNSINHNNTVQMSKLEQIHTVLLQYLQTSNNEQKQTKVHWHLSKDAVKEICFKEMAWHIAITQSALLYFFKRKVQITCSTWHKETLLCFHKQSFSKISLAFALPHLFFFPNSSSIMQRWNILLTHVCTISKPVNFNKRSNLLQLNPLWCILSTDL